MYERILIALENSPTDRAVLDHIGPLARLTGAALTLIHVADGFVARNQDQFNLSDSEEIKTDRDYIEGIKAELSGQGHDVSTVLAQGDPAKEIAAAADAHDCDLIAMATHGHRLLADFVLGSVASQVRHLTTVPVLLVPAKKRAS
jgi:nucleotide-binding universal stress UspA family protein